MAAYAATVTSLMKRAIKIDAVRGIGMFAGKCDITNYNSTGVAITDITGKFKSSAIIAVLGGTAEGADLVEWIDSTNSFKAYVASTGAQVANDVDVGEFDFIAIGFV